MINTHQSSGADGVSPATDGRPSPAEYVETSGNGVRTVVSAPSFVSSYASPAPANAADAARAMASFRQYLVDILPSINSREDEGADEDEDGRAGARGANSVASREAEECGEAVELQPKSHDGAPKGDGVRANDPSAFKPLYTTRLYTHDLTRHISLDEVRTMRNRNPNTFAAILFNCIRLIDRTTSLNLGLPRYIIPEESDNNSDLFLTRLCMTRDEYAAETIRQHFWDRLAKEVVQNDPTFRKGRAYSGIFQQERTALENAMALLRLLLPAAVEEVCPTEAELLHAKQSNTPIIDVTRGFKRAFFEENRAIMSGVAAVGSSSNDASSSSSSSYSRQLAGGGTRCIGEILINVLARLAVMPGHCILASQVVSSHTPATNTLIHKNLLWCEGVGTIQSATANPNAAANGPSAAHGNNSTSSVGGVNKSLGSNSSITAVGETPKAKYVIGVVSDPITGMCPTDRSGGVASPLDERIILNRFVLLSTLLTALSGTVYTYQIADEKSAMKRNAVGRFNTSSGDILFRTLCDPLRCRFGPTVFCSLLNYATTFIDELDSHVPSMGVSFTGSVTNSTVGHRAEEVLYLSTAVMNLMLLFKRHEGSRSLSHPHSAWAVLAPMSTKETCFMLNGLRRLMANRTESIIAAHGNGNQRSTSAYLAVESNGSVVQRSVASISAYTAAVVAPLNQLQKISPRVLSRHDDFFLLFGSILRSRRVMDVAGDEPDAVLPCIVPLLEFASSGGTNVLSRQLESAVHTMSATHSKNARNTAITALMRLCSDRGTLSLLGTITNEPVPTTLGTFTSPSYADLILSVMARIIAVRPPPPTPNTSAAGGNKTAEGAGTVPAAAPVPPTPSTNAPFGEDEDDIPLPPITPCDRFADNNAPSPGIGDDTDSAGGEKRAATYGEARAAEATAAAAKRPPHVSDPLYQLMQKQPLFCPFASFREACASVIANVAPFASSLSDETVRSIAALLLDVLRPEWLLIHPANPNVLALIIEAVASLLQYQYKGTCPLLLYHLTLKKDVIVRAAEELLEGFVADPRSAVVDAEGSAKVLQRRAAEEGRQQGASAASPSFTDAADNASPASDGAAPSPVPTIAASLDGAQERKATVGYRFSLKSRRVIPAEIRYRFALINTIRASVEAAVPILQRAQRKAQSMAMVADPRTGEMVAADSVAFGVGAPVDPVAILRRNCFITVLPQPHLVVLRRTHSTIFDGTGATVQRPADYVFAAMTAWCLVSCMSVVARQSAAHH